MNDSSATTTSSTSGRKPKRIRRKCAHEGCDNRVVQGGVCVTHGAKRKLCSFPDCDKAVKLAGYCSTHGPSRRKCGTAGCTRVAVQGGQCLSHGARRRLCCYPGVTEGDKGGGGAKQCQKNAIMGGMCKKHYDRMQDAEGMLVMSLCVPVNKGSGNNSSSEEGDDVFPQQHHQQQQPRGGIVSASGSLKSEEVDSAASSILSSTINEAQIQPPSLSMPVPPLQPIDNNGNHEFARPHKKVKPSHTRGLSIFDDLSTVDAIISSGAENRAHEVVVPAFPPPLQPQVVRSAPPLPMPLHQQQQQGFPPPKLMNKITPESVSGTGMNSSCVMPPLGVLSSIKTPTAQVSFADMPPNKTNRSSNNRPSSSGSDDEPCTGNSSCVCKACRSPTLAIFEQMIEASHKIERAEVGVIDPSSEKYAGLSPPKLSRGNSNSSSSSPRKHSGKTVRRQGLDTMTPKNVSFVPEEEPTSSGSVVRKVSSQNIVGEAQTEEASTAGGSAVGEQAGGPTSQALPLPQQEVDDSGVSRTVSHDAPPSPESSGAHLIYLQPAQPHPQHHHHHPDATFQNQQLLQYHYVSYHGPSHHDTYHNMHHPAPSYYQGQGHALPQYRYQAPPSHAPLTPQLYDHQGHAADSQSVQYPNSAPAAALVSSHSTYLQEQQQQLHLLPRRRESIEHLFIPKEV